uniref:Uncharacterized protein n=1 Tax=Candidatus Kentrum sp. LPFa TaxID=2126335 RepID=A0A450XI55_9GAMM|nr:MAG: hypothetical protein BECKLPF1236A_GA0070988_100746 [Candidatus Kentron sp. LPFa]VFK28993.1 MAG: hypothetical protein BECKLPF1236C_GA0070990_1007811 [Candidatus Kentron sp. LPFa]
MKQQPRFGAVGWIATHIHHLLLPVDARSDPPYVGTFFIYWGDETLNMIVNGKLIFWRFASIRQSMLRHQWSIPLELPGQYEIPGTRLLRRDT